MSPTAAPPEDRVVFVGRETSLTTVRGHLREACEAHISPMEAVLSITRTPPRAVVLSLAEVGQRAEALLAALGRAQPDTPVYLLARPEDEPRARNLLRAGAEDYLVVPDDLVRLPALVEGRADARAAVAAEPEVDAYLAGARVAPGLAMPAPTEPDIQTLRLFRTACVLTSLAALEPRDLFTQGTRAILEAAQAEIGAAFLRDPTTGALDCVTALGPDGAPVASETALAERSTRTGETLILETNGRRAGPALLCIPVQHRETAFGALCLGGDAAGRRRAVEPLVQALASLVDASARRD